MATQLELVPVRGDAAATTDLLRVLNKAHVHGPKTAVPEPVNAADKKVATALTALEAGRQMVDIRTVNQWMEGKFAFASALRTGEKIVRVRDAKTGDLTFKSGRWSQTFEAFMTTTSYRPFDRYFTSAATVVPYVPVEARQTVQGDLRGKYVVWEQEWREGATRERMHLDPALIEPVIGNLYIVHAVWDLTSLERAALGG